MHMPRNHPSSRPRRHRPIILAPLTALLLVAAACGDDDGAAPTTTTTPTTTTAPTTTVTAPPDGAPDLGALQPVTSCGDAVFVFATPDDTTMVSIQVPDLLATADDGDNTLDLEIDLADPAGDATATLEVGTALGATACNDVPDPAYEVTGSWQATAGTIRITASEVPDGPLEVCTSVFEVTAGIDDVTFAVDGDAATAPALELEGSVGWCPG